MSRLSILVISNLFPPLAEGGYEERCRQVVNELRARGHEVTVLTSRPPPGVPAPADPPWVLRQLTPVGRLGWPWVRVPKLFALEQDNLRILRDALTSSRAEVIHAWNLGGLGKSLLLAAARARPLVTDISDHWAAGAETSDPVRSWWRRHPFADLLARPWQRGLPRGPLNFGSAYFTSRDLRDRTAAVIGDRRLAEAPVIYCGIRLERFPWTPSLREAGRLRCVYTGRLHPDKGVDVACAAVAALAGEDVQLDVFGAGEDAYVEALHGRYAHAANIHFRGRLAPESAGSAYDEADCLIFPSVWAEPFALVPLEAAARGIPIVGTTTGGSGEFLVHEHTALVVPPGDPEALSHSLLRLRDDPALGHRLALTARELVVEQFSFKRMSDRILAELIAAIKIG